MAFLEWVRWRWRQILSCKTFPRESHLQVDVARPPLQRRQREHLPQQDNAPYWWCVSEYHPACKDIFRSLRKPSGVDDQEKTSPRSQHFEWCFQSMTCSYPKSIFLLALIVSRVFTLCEAKFDACCRNSIRSSTRVLLYFSITSTNCCGESSGKSQPTLSNSRFRQGV